jgi:hypothetical protein
LEYTPALFIKTIVDRIFADIGYTYNSNFMSLLSFEKLIMPIPLSDKISDEQYNIDYLQVNANDPITTAITLPVQAVITTTTNQTVLFTPAVFGFNNDSPANTSIYLRVYNKTGATTAINVSLTLIQLES